MYCFDVIKIDQLIDKHLSKSSDGSFLPEKANPEVCRAESRVFSFGSWVRAARPLTSYWGSRQRGPSPPAKVTGGAL